MSLLGLGFGKVPVVGQPCSVKGVTASIVIQCHCDAKTVLIAIGNSIVECGGCQRRYCVLSLVMDAKGSANVQVGQVTSTQPPAGIVGLTNQ